jgi:hypothetical protein
MSIIKDFIVKAGLQIEGTSATTSAITGALQVSGGAGLAGSIFVAGTSTFGAITPGTGSTSSLLLQTLQVKGGGIGVVGDSYFGNKLLVGGQTFITDPTNSSNTSSGAFVTLGGGAFGGNIYSGGQMYAQGNQLVVTTATLGNYGVSAIFAGTDTAVSANTGSVTVWNTSTLQSITNRGAVTSNAINITNSTITANSGSGALVVAGGVGVGANLYAGGTIAAGANLSVATTAGFYSTTDATAINAGAVVIAGGLAVGRTIYAQSEVITSSNASVGTVGSNALAVTAGGLGVAGTALIQGNTVLSSTTNGVSTNSGQALLVGGGVGVAGNVAAGKVITVDATAATTLGAGSLQIGGGGYFGNNIVVMGTAQSTGTTASNALYVKGGVGVEGSMYVGGPVTFSSPVTFNGTATYVLSTNSYYTDNLIELHVPQGGVSNQWQSDDGKDIGLRFHYYNRTASTDSNAALVLADDSQVLEWYGSGAETNTGTFSGSGLASYGGFKLGYIQLMSGTNATSALTGALRVQFGGIGAAGNLWLGGTNQTASSSTVNAQSIVVNTNGLGVNGDSYFANNLGVGGSLGVANGGSIGTYLTITGTGATGSTSSISAQALRVSAGGIGVSGDSYLGGNLSVTGVTQVANATNSTAIGNGALIVNGGASINNDLRVGGSIYGTTFTGTANTATNIAGGAYGSIPYQINTGTTGFIAITTQTGYVLATNGTSATWQAIASIPVGYANSASNVAITTTNVSAVFYPTFVAGTAGYNPLYADSALTYNPNTDVMTFSGTTDASTSTNGTIVVGGGVGVAKNLVVGAALTNYGIHSVLNNTQATNTASGALQIVGGVGVGADLYASRLFDNSNRVVTQVNPVAGTAIGIRSITNVGTATSFTVDNFGVTALTAGSIYIGVSANTGSVTIDNLGVRTLTAGTDTAASSNTGTITVWNTSNLQTITNRGAATTNAISITNGTNATNTNSGALIVSGGIATWRDLYVGGTITRNGAISAPGWLTTGIGLSIPGSTYTDSSLTGAQTATAINSLGIPIIAASGGSPVYADAANLYIGGAPLAGSGATITNPWSLYVASGKSKIADGTVANSTNSGALQVVGGVGLGGAVYAGGTVTAGGAPVASATVSGFVTNNALIATYTSPAINTTSTQNLDTFSTSTYRTAKYLVQLVDTGAAIPRVHTTEMMIFHDGGNVYKSEYGIVSNVGELGTFDAIISGGNVQLQFTPSFPTLTPSALTIKVYRTGITL